MTCRMPFGKHKGQLLTEVPTRYLMWMFRECDLDAPLYDAVRRELSACTELPAATFSAC